MHPQRRGSKVVLHRCQRVTKGKRHWEPRSWELLLEGNHLGKRENFLMICLFSSAFIYNIDYSSYFCFGVAKQQR